MASGGPNNKYIAADKSLVMVEREEGVSRMILNQQMICLLTIQRVTLEVVKTTGNKRKLRRLEYRVVVDISSS